MAPWRSASRPPWASRLASTAVDATTLPDLTAEVDLICKTLAETRPTAVNLFWGIAQIRDLYNQLAAGNTPIPEIKMAVVALARRSTTKTLPTCRKLGAFGAALLPQQGTVLTHCNAGALAACGYGSALGVIRAAIEQGKQIDVFADETRPFNQGTRLTAWELVKDNIPTTLICDNMAGYFMSKGRISAVIVGADRIAANGDAANKIGTYSLSILAKEHGIPFYVAAPFNTIDLATASGDLIPIEQRAAREVTHVGGVQVTPNGVAIQNPAFDVTPARYITAIVTERGVLRSPYSRVHSRHGRLAAAAGTGPGLARPSFIPIPPSVFQITSLPKGKEQPVSVDREGGSS